MKQNKPFALVGLSFGTNGSNEALADIVRELDRIFNISKLVLQEEIVDYWRIPKNSYIISEHREEGKYLDTIEVLRQAKEIVKDKPVIFIGHPAHLPRIHKTAKILGFNLLDDKPILWRIQGFLEEVPYSHNDKQIWVRNKWFFKLWNFIANFRLKFLSFKCPKSRDCPFYQKSCDMGDYYNCGQYNDKQR